MFFKTFFNHETLPVAPSPSALRVSQRNPPCWNGTQAPHHGFPWTTCEIMPNFLYISKLDLTINWVLHSDNKSPARSLKRWVFHGFFHEFSMVGGSYMLLWCIFPEPSRSKRCREQSIEGGLHSEVRQLGLHAANSSGRGRWNPGSACHTAQEF